MAVEFSSNPREWCQITGQQSILHSVQENIFLWITETFKENALKTPFDPRLNIALSNRFTTSFEQIETDKGSD